MDDDTWLIIGIVIFGIGGFLLLIVTIRIILWCCRTREHTIEERKRLRKLEHLRHLEEYSIRTADTVSDYGVSRKETPHSARSTTSDSVFRYEDLTGVNPAYVVTHDHGQLPPGTYIRIHPTRSVDSSTEWRSPHASTGAYSPDESKMAEVSEVEVGVSHPGDQEGVARVMVGGFETGAVPSSTLSSSEPALNEERSYYRVGAKVEASSTFSYGERGGHYGDILF